jgi:hypothetical protein
VISPCNSGFVLWWLLFGTADSALKPYLQEDTASYLESWETLHSLSQQAMESEDATVRAHIQAMCAEAAPSVVGNSTEEYVVIAEGSVIVTVQQVQEQCYDRACVIPAASLFSSDGSVQRVRYRLFQPSKCAAFRRCEHCWTHRFICCTFVL